MVGDEREILLHEAVGFAQLVPQKVRMERDSIFDVASLTKVIATATAWGICVDRGLLDPNAPMTRYLPDHQGNGGDKITARHLASHTSGFAADPRAAAAGTGETMFKGLLAESPTWEPNVHYEYACRNIILLSLMIERVTNQSFGEFCKKEIFGPLGMKDSSFNQVTPSRRLVGTHVELGVSHNEDTLAAGRAIGNAGLFTTATDLYRVCQMMLNGGVFHGKRLLSQKIVAEFTTAYQLPPLPSHGFIWMTGMNELHRPSALSACAFGHGGYTGHALWIDPEKNIFTLILSNRTHPHDVPGTKEAQFRTLGRIADLALEALGF